MSKHFQNFRSKIHAGSYQIKWFNDTRDTDTTAIINDLTITMPSLCSPFYRSLPRDMGPDKLKQCIPGHGIIATYHNPKGYEFIIYENGLCQFIGWGNVTGILNRI